MWINIIVNIFLIFLLTTRSRIIIFSEYLIKADFLVRVDVGYLSVFNAPACNNAPIILMRFSNRRRQLSFRVTYV